ncbi:MAG TPA: FMN-binding negative transcriptional regulator [Polyangia bacterium]|nr:FMN-binding negative transcriptional regulator [Polyangia bacterium]
MYLPKGFEETRVEVLHAFIRARSFGALVAMTAEGLSVDHIPFLLEETDGSLGVLRGHVARANPIVNAALAGTDAVVVFQGPDHYITPSWYPTKQETGKVVPTWNYVVVHAHGPLRLVDDPKWLRAHVEVLVDAHEGERQDAWKVTDAPDDFVTKLLGAIVGVELPIARLSGKWKLGQNRSEADQAGVAAGLLRENDGSAEELARLMKKG